MSMGRLRRMRRTTGLFLGLSWLLSTLALATPAAAQDPDHNLQRCGTEEEPYVCGQIGIELVDGDVVVEEVIARNGGDPGTDILRACATLYCWLISVEVGTEEVAIARYASDPDVESASLREWDESYAMPDTAVPQPHGPAVYAWAAALAALVALGFVWWGLRRAVSRR